MFQLKTQTLALIGVSLAAAMSGCLAGKIENEGEEQDEVEVETAPLSKEPDAQAGPSINEWRDMMSKTGFPEEGCYEASYPDTKWKKNRCLPASRASTQGPSKHGRVRVSAPVSVNVGNGVNDDVAMTSEKISIAQGSFPSVTGITSEFDSGGTNLTDDWTLQINSNFFSNTTAVQLLCASGSTPLTCQGWEQFVYGNNDSGLCGSTNCVLIEIWLYQYGPTGAKPCPPGWNPSGSSCFKNVAVQAVPTFESFPAIDELANFALRGNASDGGNDTVTVYDGNNAYAAVASDGYLQLAKAWNLAEFNFFGGGNFSTAAVLPNTGVKVTVDLALGFASGAKVAPSCSIQSETGEQNSLSLVPHSCCQRAFGPLWFAPAGIQFAETSDGKGTLPFCLSQDIVPLL
jgi:hypothetical protein